MTEPRAFRLYGERERARLGELAGKVADAWAERWLPEGRGVRVTCLQAAGMGARFARASWTRVSAHSDQMWICATENEADTQALGAALFGAAAGVSTMAASAARVAAFELAAALLGADPAAQAKRWTGASAAPPPSQWQPGSAGAVLELHLDGSRLNLVASPEWALGRLRGATARVNGAAPLARLSEAARGAACDLRVVAGAACIELRELRGLRVGDVIALGRPLDTALGVELAGRGAPQLQARLGTLRGRRAVALAARTE